MRHVRRPRARRAPSILTFLAAAGLATSPVGAQELRYSIAPQAERIQWTEDLGLDDANLFGGRFGFTFNQYIGLHGFYLTRSGVRAELSRLPLLDTLDMPLTDQDTDLDLYGADLRINVGDGPFSPFLSAGGAVLRFDPDSAPRTSQIGLKLGGGLQFGRPGGARLTIFAEDLMFRLNRYALAARDPMGPLQADAESDDLRHNLALGAAVHIPLGGSAPFEEGMGIGLGDVGMPIELFAGRLDFDDEAGLERQDLIGARLGVNFGRLVSLRGYFWHGVNDDFDDTAPIRSWGGEAQFNLGAGAGIIPYLLAGAGQIDFRDDYRDVAGNPRDDRTSLILGGGAALALNEHLRLNFSARDYLFADADLEDVASTDELRHNWMFSLGFTFNVFADEPRRPVRTLRTTDTVRVTRSDTVTQRDTVFVDAESGQRLAPAQGRALLREGAAREPSEERVRSRAVEPRDAQARGDEQRERRPDERDYRGDETVVVPVPVQGEIYVRYGPEQDGPPVDRRTMFQRQGPPTVMQGGERQTTMREDIRGIIRDELERARMEEAAGALMMRDTTPASVAARGLTSEQFLDRLEQRLTQRNAMQRDSVRAIVREEVAAATPDVAMEERIARIVDDRMRSALDDLERRQQPAQRDAPSVVVVQGDTARVVRAAPARPIFTEFQPQYWAGYTGFTVNDGAQFLLGGRLDLGALSTGLREVDFIPELAIGVGSGATSLYIGANARYRFTGFQIERIGLVRPYGSLGLGLLNFSNEVEGRDGLDLVINAAYGVTAEVPGLRGFANSGAREVFIEHQGIGFFDLNRLLVGLLWRY